jgi:predicted DCC family thiol-disulfide oxidoreductase YuxK
VSEHRLVFDADCGFCRWSVERIARRARPGTIRLVEMQSDEGRALLAHLPPDVAESSWHLAAPDGTLHSAGDVVAPLASLVRGGGAVAAAARRFPRATDRAYRLGARNRALLGRVTRTRRATRA